MENKKGTEMTCVIIKPDAFERNLTARILSKIEESGLRLVAIKSLKISKEQAEKFYYVHKGKHFFESLTNYISSGKIVVAVFEGENAIEKVRKIMGATDPKKAEEGTIRKIYGIDIEKNSIHGSDSPEAAKFEISFFFSVSEII
jgi:nucleoside-diphosphate kinase